MMNLINYDDDLNLIELLIAEMMDHNYHAEEWNANKIKHYRKKFQ